jgi:hypothetical protein
MHFLPENGKPGEIFRLHVAILYGMPNVGFVKNMEELEGECIFGIV